MWCVFQFWCGWYTVLTSLFILCYMFQSYFLLANPRDKLYITHIIPVPSYPVSRGWIEHLGGSSCWRLQELFIISEWNLIGFQTRELRHSFWYSKQWLYVQFEVDLKEKTNKKKSCVRTLLAPAREKKMQADRSRTKTWSYRIDRVLYYYF